MSDELIRRYYACFNERRMADAEGLFASDAVLEMPPFIRGARGYAAYEQFFRSWHEAFPDAQLTIEHVEQRGDTICEVDLVATGTHCGSLDLGEYGLLKPSGVRLTLRLRELVEVRNGLIVFTSLAFDINYLVQQLYQSPA